MLEPWRTGIVVQIKEETPLTRRFWIQIPEVESFNFIPGQFVTLDLPIHEKKNKRWRSYSIASSPDGTNVIELVIVFLEGGAGTTYIFNEVKEGSELLLRGPQGVFVLPQTIDRDLFLICTGTGVAPYRSMLHNIKRNKIPHKNVYLIFGTRLFKDCLYYEELRELQNDIEGYVYLPTFSREAEENSSIRKGYVHSVYEEIVSKNKPNAYFYLCGWKNMIDEAKERILALGYDKKDIHLELYG
ncbi:ferredoxin--NADP reductase [Segetibacter aerophilus]|uniref:Ferredoxin--NADP(+) reductase n=1 Tax=Segetibacter aerophilus TaxID=670293 RepID=A0A512BBR8_9BACT|nr:FAD-dependent oxidoreductase [Segetibacter aerophilus]GEO09423.1 ferredoxin--NADP(+) reductase [Segetibacter aerophilus]